MIRSPVHFAGPPRGSLSFPGGIITVEAIALSPDGEELARAGLDTVVLPNSGSASAAGLRAYLSAPRYPRAGMSTVVTLRYKAIKGTGQASITIPDGVEFVSAYPELSGIDGNVATWSNLTAFTGLLKARIFVAESATTGDQLTVTGTVSDSAISVGMEKTMVVR